MIKGMKKRCEMMDTFQMRGRSLVSEWMSVADVDVNEWDPSSVDGM